MNQTLLQSLAHDPAAFRSALRLSDGQPWRPDPWQDEFFLATDAGWQRAIGRDVPGGFSRAWSIRHRGASKTHDIATMIVWALFAAAPRRPIRGVVAAADADQAALVADSVRRIVRANEWLEPLIDVQRQRIVNPHTGSECGILSSDAPSSFGLLPDFIICDELTCWQSRDLWDSLFSSAAKQRHCFLSILSNAGHLNTWQAELWDALSSDPSWFCHRPTEVASWIDPAALAEQRRVLPAIVYARLWGNKWTVNEMGAIPPDQLARATVLSGPQPCRDDLSSGYVAAVDLAVRRDKAAVVVLEFRADGVVRLARAQSWHPLDFPGREIPQAVVEQAVLQAHADYYLGAVVFDPAAGGYAMAQRLSLHGLRCDAMPFTAQNLDLMAKSLLTAFAEGRIRIYHHSELVSDLAGLKLVEGNAGWKLVAPRSAAGHHDLGIAFTIGLAAALAWCREVGPDYWRLLPAHVVERLGHPSLVHRPNHRPSLETLLTGGANRVQPSSGSRNPLDVWNNLR